MNVTTTKKLTVALLLALAACTKAQAQATVLDFCVPAAEYGGHACEQWSSFADLRTCEITRRSLHQTEVRALQSEKLDGWIEYSTFTCRPERS